MYDYIPLFVPSNLGETKLNIIIDPGLDGNEPNFSKLQEHHKGHDETYCFEGFYCNIWTKTAETAQRTALRLSRQLEKHPYHPVQSDRLYFLPLFDKVNYSLTVTPKAHHKRPVIRIVPRTENHLRLWTCKIYASNLVQLQEALFSHEQNLLKKQLQVLNQQRSKHGQANY